MSATVLYMSGSLDGFVAGLMVQSDQKPRGASSAGPSSVARRQRLYVVGGQRLTDQSLEVKFAPLGATVLDVDDSVMWIRR